MMDISKTKAYLTLEQYYSYVLAGIFFVTVGLGLYLIILPQYYSAQNTSATAYQQSLQLLTQRQQYLADLQVMEANYQKLDTHILSYMHQILPELAPAVAFTEVEALFQKSKFTVQSINIVPETPGQPAANAKGLYTVTQVNVNIVGDAATYADFKDLLQQLEHNAHLIELGSLSYNANATSYTLSFKIYSL